MGDCSIEEKIYQRQIMKGEVAAAVEECRGAQFGVDTGGRHFSREELRELFMLHLVRLWYFYMFTRIPKLWREMQDIVLIEWRKHAGDCVV